MSASASATDNSSSNSSDNKSSHDGSSTIAQDTVAHDDVARSDGQGNTNDVRDAAPHRRLLRDVEAHERRILYEALYKSLDDSGNDDDNDVHSASLHTPSDDAQQTTAREPTVRDTVRSAREATSKLLRVTAMPLSQKAAHCGTLMRQLSEQRNAHVLRVFTYVSVAMLTLPLIALFAAMHIVAPRLQIDGTVCGGVAAVATAACIAAMYTAYAVYEERQGDAHAKDTVSTHAATNAKKKT